MANYDLVLHGDRVFDGRRAFGKVYIGVKGGKIEKITDSRISAIGTEEAYEVPDGCILFPGFIDPHWHSRDWELAHKETYATGSRAAAAHGITTAGVMPNTKPAISNPHVLEANVEKADADSIIDTYFWVGLDDYRTPDILERMGEHPRVCGSKIFAEQLYQDELEKRIEASKRLGGGKRTAIHCEDRRVNEAMERVYRNSDKPWAFSLSRPDISEACCIISALGFAKKYGVPLHVLHISSRAGLDAYSTGRRATDTCETAFHYLMFTMDDMEKDPRLKMKPPLKGEGDMDALREALSWINCIGTDHAPHLPGEKEGKWDANIPGIPVHDAYSGCIGFLVNGLKLEPKHVAGLCSWNPGRVLGLNDRGVIEEGKRADFAVFSPDYRWSLGDDDIRSKCGWSPWKGEDFKGKTVATFREGVCIAKEDDGEMQVIEKPGQRLEV